MSCAPMVSTLGSRSGREPEKLSTRGNGDDPVWRIDTETDLADDVTQSEAVSFQTHPLAKRSISKLWSQTQAESFLKVALMSPAHVTASRVFEISGSYRGRQGLAVGLPSVGVEIRERPRHARVVVGCSSLQ
jgi:hypothetical protein